MPPTTDDLEIFVFTAANPTAQENLLKSIKHRIQPESIVFDGFGEAGKDLRDELGRIKETAGGFYAWGAEPRGHAATTWSKMARSDYILAYYDKSYHYVARVLATFHEQDLATSIWGTNEETGKTWEYMYFLTKPVKIDASASWIADLLSSKELSFKESSWMYQGFNRIGGKNREAILRTCGSVQGFVNRLMDHEGDSVPPQLLLASGESEEKAETSLDTDRIAQGYQLEKLTTDVEGRKRIREHVTYERSSKNRALAIEIHGTTCAVCGFNFDDIYGKEHADGYVQIHHVKQLSQYEGKVEPATDMFPLCANCHAMAHRKRDTVTSIADLKALIQKAKG